MPYLAPNDRPTYKPREIIPPIPRLRSRKQHKDQTLFPFPPGPQHQPTPKGPKP